MRDQHRTYFSARYSSRISFNFKTEFAHAMDKYRPWCGEFRAMIMRAAGVTMVALRRDEVAITEIIVYE